ncbi:hypothetical protein Tco_0149733 [Tanacetum coccineum]
MGLINAFYRIALSVAQITLYPRKAPTDRCPVLTGTLFHSFGGGDDEGIDAGAANTVMLVSEMGISGVWHFIDFRTLEGTGSSVDTVEGSAGASTGKETAILPSLPPESKHEVVSDEDDTPRDKEIAKLMALISKSFKKIYKPTNNTLRTSSNTRNKNLDKNPRTDKRSGYVITP